MGWTALFYAAAHGRENIVSLLIQHSESEGSLASKDRSGKTALIVASAHGHYDVVQTLLRRRGNQSFATSLYINETDNSGRTALSYASERGYESIVDLLLAQSANPSIQDDGGRNPLSYATEQGSNMVVKSLLSAMAPYIESEVDGRDKDGASPFSYAVRGYKVPGEGSISSGARKNDQIWSTYHQLQSRLSVIDLLLSTGFVDINSKDNTGRTPFSHAAGATFENGDIVKTLIQISGTRDMDLDMADDDGRTPLSYAAQAQADKDYFRLKHAFEMPTPDDYTSASRKSTQHPV
ncbi:ankyrin [Ascobolus immersus RN42]|uniref:Ankyrin n=1 Tax=Ascobolus immersus RN42 TaxID=1160509 RepID=A0A3N4HTI2_ASCIM|nr:ankyrin [Ascobolus immersus RN42]